MYNLLITIMIVFFSTALAIDISDGSQLQLKSEEGSLIGLGNRENDELELKVLFGVSGPLRLELQDAQGNPEVYSAVLDDKGRLLIFEFDTWVDLGDLLQSKGIEFKLEREDDLSGIAQLDALPSSNDEDNSQSTDD